MDAMKTLFAEAETVFPGGVNSPARAFGAAGGEPLVIRRGRGANVYDLQEKAYIDYVLSFGAHILGHAHPEVVSGVRAALEHGFCFGTTAETEVALGQALTGAIPWMEQVRFVNSGTEAAMSAVRLARGVTARKKIVKFTHAYHGHADTFLAAAGSGMATCGIPASKGVPEEVTDLVIVLDYADRDALDAVFRLRGDDIAGVIVEPVGGNYGVIPPDIPFLKRLREITQTYGTLLIFDEVITGFRFHYGTAGDLFGVIPDIVCLGKIIGGGLPVGAYGGKTGLMCQLAPQGEVYQASTFGGHPLVMQAGLTTLAILERERKKYGIIARMARVLAQDIAASGAHSTVYKGMFSLAFDEQEDFALFFRGMRDAGIFFAPSPYESNFVSFAHSWDDIEKTRAIMRNL
ncbi:MAG: glutamate-1-semialdehyde 2,1-aminomutase [Candidatus Omnitrophica bacterium]|nr:glutamate-1-semialdehyde 2,1-aminomutase [Candidatus Omnitrophota bacterium]